MLFIINSTLIKFRFYECIFYSVARMCNFCYDCFIFGLERDIIRKVHVSNCHDLDCASYSNRIRGNQMLSALLAFNLEFAQTKYYKGSESGARCHFIVKLRRLNSAADYVQWIDDPQAHSMIFETRAFVYSAIKSLLSFLKQNRCYILTITCVIQSSQSSKKHNTIHILLHPIVLLQTEHIEKRLLTIFNMSMWVCVCVQYTLYVDIMVWLIIVTVKILNRVPKQINKRNTVTKLLAADKTNTLLYIFFDLHTHW